MLTIIYDNPSGSGTLFTFKLRKQDLVDRLIEVKTLLGRPLTIADAKQALIAIVNEVRAGKTGIPEDFSFTPYIGIELEA